MTFLGLPVFIDESVEVDVLEIRSAEDVVKIAIKKILDAPFLCPKCGAYWRCEHLGGQSPAGL